MKRCLPSKISERTTGTKSCASPPVYYSLFIDRLHHGLFGCYNQADCKKGKGRKKTIHCPLSSKTYFGYKPVWVLK